MLKLATTIKNPGEPGVDSRYHSPAELKALGYTGRVLFETTGLSGVPDPEAITDTELRRWAQQTQDSVTRAVEACEQVGLEAYLFYDVLVLARDVVERNKPGLTCKNRPDVLCPASDGVYKQVFASLDAMIRRWPGIAGIMLRFGDTEAQRLPHLLGNDLYTPHCPRCSQFGRADRVVQVLEQAHRLVVEKHQKRLIARAWNVRPYGMHDTADLAERIAQRLPGSPDDDRLVLSFKFTETDFWRYQPWNRASLRCGGRPVMYELQCQREFEGKGGVPNWQVPLWRDGAPESGDAAGGGVNGLAAAAERVNLVGLLSWVRGGGWGGPFLRDETWIDANAYAVPRLADDLSADPSQIARDWVDQRLGLSDPAAAEVVVRILKHSPEMVRQAFYIGPFATQKANPWHPAADWIQDDVLDAAAAWRMVQRLEPADLDAAVTEKVAAVATVAADRRDLQQLLGDRNHPRLEKLVNALLYTESLFEALRDLIAGLVAFRRYEISESPADAEVARRQLFDAQSHWNHHTQRHGSAPGTATPFRETRFWEITQDILSRLS
ncbi:MAG: hypothetical protein AAGG38_12765 [Planctomycetota bacterium]